MTSGGAEAAGAVLGDNDWRWVNASISPDGRDLVAEYEFRPAATRIVVTLSRERCSTVRRRLREIHRQLGLQQAV